MNKIYLVTQKHNLIKNFIISIFLVILYIYIYQNHSYKPISSVKYISINSCTDTQQGESNLFIVRNNNINTNILIDTGPKVASYNLINTLSKYNINKLDYVFISHPHYDHYEGLYSIMSNDIKIDNIIYNDVSDYVCNLNELNKNNCLEFNKILTSLKKKGTKIQTIEEFNPILIYLNKQKFILEPIYFHDGISDPIGLSSMNDTSIVFQIIYGTNNILITGDLEQKGSEFILKTKPDLLKTINILKIPHHAATPTAIDDFFYQIKPDISIIPAFKSLWEENPRTQKVHNILHDLNSKTYVNGINGNITLDLYPNYYIVHTER